MKLYHATDPTNKESIMKEGLKAVWGFVYMTPDLNHARKLGKLIFEIDSTKLNQEYLGSYREMICDIMKTDDYWHYGDDIPAKLLTIKELSDDNNN